MKLPVLPPYSGNRNNIKYIMYSFRYNIKYNIKYDSKYNIKHNIN